MKQILKLEDVNLSELNINIGNSSVFIELLDMYQGEEICTIKLQDIVKINYLNFMGEEDFLPAYIGKIEINFGYVARPELANYYVNDEDKELFVIAFEGSLDIEILCTKCEVIKRKI